MIKTISKFIVVSLCLLLSVVNAQPTPAKAITEQKQSKLSPEQVLNMLKEGNQRFLNDQMRNYNYVKDMKISTNYGQHPIAIIFNCIDSRSIAETLFDQGIGSIFVSRIAGNVVDKDVLGGMEFATSAAGASLIVVMGHTHCGAVQGACQSNGVGQGNLKNLFASIKPAILSVKQQNKTPLQCDKTKVVNDIAQDNVVQQIKVIQQQSPVIMQLIKDNKLMVVGAMHDIQTGQVIFFDAQGKSL